jgi:hypothetical protein
MPRTREHVAVLGWMFDHRPDVGDLEFVTWSSPKEVAQDPFTNEPATLVELVVKNKSTGADILERLSFYLRDLEVIGSLSQPHAHPKAAVCV